jgi:hypothetical protein
MISRLRTWLPSITFLVGGVAAIFAFLTDLFPLMHAISVKAPVIAISPRDFAGLPLGIGLLAVSVAVAMPYPRAFAHRQRRPKRRDWISICVGICLAIVAGSLVLVPVAPPFTTAVLGSLLENRNYVLCPPRRTWERPQLTRWARRSSDEAQARCPE